jgi:hypothetical protein
VNIYLCLFACFVYLCVVSRWSDRGGNDDLGGQDEFGGEYRKFDAEDLNYQQEFAEDADGGKSNLVCTIIRTKYFRCLAKTRLNSHP